MTGPTPGRSEIDLRVDIDERGPDSPVMGRVSADVYHVSRFELLDGEPMVSPAYRNSWTVDVPEVRAGGRLDAGASRMRSASPKPGRGARGGEPLRRESALPALASERFAQPLHLPSRRHGGV